MGDEATCDKGFIDTGKNASGYETVAPCPTCKPERFEAVMLANRHRTSIHDALMAVTPGKGHR